MAGTESTKLDSLIKSADDVVSRCAGMRVNGKVSSKRTQDYSREMIRESCRRLHRLGFYLSDVAGLQKKHIDALVQDWRAKGLVPKTIQNQFSRLKIFCGWLGKPGIVSSAGAIGHLPGVAPAALKVSTITDTTKSWSGNGIDLTAKLTQARLNDQRHGAMLILGVAFGLRKKEMLRIKPWRADKGMSLDIDGSVAKNGKFRSIRLEGNEGGLRGGDEEQDEFGRAQRWALNEAKKLCKKTDTLGWPGLSIKQAENRYYHYMKVLGITKFDAGVTGHGLRAEYAENMLILRGLMPASLGGVKGQMPKEKVDEIILDAQGKIGHEDKHTSGAYFGIFRNMAHGEGLGARIGTVLVVNDEADTFALLYCNPAPVKGRDGKYKVKTEAERSRTVVTAVVEAAGQEDRKVGIAEFVQRYPHMSDKVIRQLSAVGFGAG